MKLSLKVLFSPTYSLAVSIFEELIIGRYKSGHRISLKNSKMVLGESSSSKGSLNSNTPLTAVSTEAICKYFFHLLCYVLKCIVQNWGNSPVGHKDLSRLFFFDPEKSVCPFLLSDHLIRLGGPYPCPSVRLLSLHGLSPSTFSSFLTAQKWHHSVPIFRKYQWYFRKYQWYTKAEKNPCS